MNKTTKNKEWNLWEEEVSKDLGKQVVGSGRTDFHKGDVISTDFLFDCKTTQAKSFSVSLKEWKKYNEWALNEGKDFALPIRFLDENRKPTGEDFVVLKYETFLALMENQNGENH